MEITTNQRLKGYQDACAGVRQHRPTNPQYNAGQALFDLEQKGDLLVRVRGAALLVFHNPSSGLGLSEVQRNCALDTANSEESCSRRSTGAEEGAVDEVEDAEIQEDESRAWVS